MYLTSRIGTPTCPSIENTTRPRGPSACASAVCWQSVRTSWSIAHERVMPLDRAAYPSTTRRSVAALVSHARTSQPSCRERGSPVAEPRWLSATSETMTTGASLASRVTS